MEAAIEPGDGGAAPSADVAEAGAPAEGAGGEREDLLADLARLRSEVQRLKLEKAEVCSRLEFVEEIVGPTEAQRKLFQEQLNSARSAALQAHRNGAGVPVRFVGRLNEPWLRSMGLSERDCALLQRGCVTGSEGVPKDVSLLGDPAFRPYDEVTKEPVWSARGGMLKLSLGDVRDRWGEDVAMEVLRCAMELDRYDASRRLGVELPWSEARGCELDPAEVIGILERELEEARRIQRDPVASAPQAPEAMEDVASEASSADATPSAMRLMADMSPTWSMVDDTCSALSDSPDYDSQWPLGRPSDLDDDTDLRYGGIAAGHPDIFDEWSLADADIEQLLRQPGTAGVTGVMAAGVGGSLPHSKGGGDVARSMLSTPRDGDLSSSERHLAEASGSSEESDEHENAEEGFAEVLREILEEEVVGSIGRLLAQTPPPSRNPGEHERRY